MKKNNLIRFAQSLVLLPMITTSLSFGGTGNQVISQNVVAQKTNIEAPEVVLLNQAIDLEMTKEAELLKAKAEAIDAYFRDRSMPLVGTGMAMVTEAEKNGLDWRLVAAIAVRESTGGRHACIKAKHNPFGWGSCKIDFDSTEEAIATIARNLGGNNPNTAHHYGGEKTTLQKLRAYNPPSIVPKYAEQVISIMDTMGKKDMAITLAVNS